MSVDLAAANAMAPPQLNATAIVVTHNAEAHVGDCIAALRSAGLDVRVVDNASTDGTTALLSASFPSVWMAANTTDLGFAAAVNQALTDVRTDVVLLVSPDCLLPSPSAQILVDTVRNDATVGVAGPCVVDADGRVRASAGPFETWASVAAGMVGGRLLRTYGAGPRRARRRGLTRDEAQIPTGQGGTAPRDVNWVSRTCLAVRADLLAELGGLDMGYFRAFEDAALCLQAWRHDARVVYQSAARVTYLAGTPTEADPSATWPDLYQGLLRFFALYRRRTYSLVRVSAFLHAVAGLGAALPRCVTAAGRARARTWESIARLALAADPLVLARPDPTPRRGTPAMRRQSEQEGHRL